MSKASQLAKNTIVIGIGRFASQFIAFFLLPLYTHFLTPEQYGALDLTITYIALLAPFLMLQLDRGAFRHLVDARGDAVKSTIIISNTLRIALSSLLIASMILIVINLFISIPYINLITGVIVSRIFLNLFMQFARGLGSNVSYAISSVLLAVLTIVSVLILLVVFNYGVDGVLTSLVIANMISVVYLFISLRLHKYISLHGSDKGMQRELLGFSLPLVPSAISWWVIQAADRTVISLFLGVASTGIYAAANRYSFIFNAFNTIFDLSWNESASMHIESEDRDKFFSEVYNTSFRLFATLGLLLITVTPFVFDVIIGSKFHTAKLLVPILITGAFLQSIVTQYSVIYIAKKITKEVLVTSLSAAAISLTLNLILVHYIGLYAAAVSMVVAFFVISVWRHFDIKKYVKIQFTGYIFIKIFALYVIVLSIYYAGGESLYIEVLNLLIAVVCFLLMSKKPLLSLVRKTIVRVKST